MRAGSRLDCRLSSGPTENRVLVLGRARTSLVHRHTPPAAAFEFRSFRFRRRSPRPPSEKGKSEPRVNRIGPQQRAADQVQPIVKF